jgi:hypothetical protein
LRQQRCASHWLMIAATTIVSRAAIVAQPRRPTLNDDYLMSCLATNASDIHIYKYFGTVQMFNIFVSSAKFKDHSVWAMFLAGL